MDQTNLILKTAVQHLYNKKGKHIRVLKVDDVTVMEVTGEECLREETEKTSTTQR